MKLNADVGEGAGNDEALFRWIDLANIACGSHAGGLEEMRAAVDLAVTYGVVIGAHPGYPDRENFGRESMSMQPGEITNLIGDQVMSLLNVCLEANTMPRYVKPHGALYHDMMEDHDVFHEVLLGVDGFPVDLPVMILARPGNEKHMTMAGELGVSLLFEAFADRAYTDDGQLVNRSMADAVHASPERMVTQAVEIARDGCVTTVGGKKLSLKADALCVHGDNEATIAATRLIYQALRQ